jgi:hypothetical protein
MNEDGTADYHHSPRQRCRRTATDYPTRVPARCYLSRAAAEWRTTTAPAWCRRAACWTAVAPDITVRCTAPALGKERKLLVRMRPAPAPIFLRRAQRLRAGRAGLFMNVVAAIEGGSVSHVPRSDFEAYVFGRRAAHS